MVHSALFLGEPVAQYSDVLVTDFTVCVRE